MQEFQTWESFDSLLVNSDKDVQEVVNPDRYEPYVIEENDHKQSSQESIVILDILL